MQFLNYKAPPPPLPPLAGAQFIPPYNASPAITNAHRDAALMGEARSRESVLFEYRIREMLLPNPPYRHIYFEDTDTVLPTVVR